MPVSLIVTVNEPDPFTTSPVPDTPLAFCAPIVNLMVGVGEAAGDVVEDAGPPPQATIASRPTREITNRLISATSVQSTGAQGDTASSYIRGCAQSSSWANAAPNARLGSRRVSLRSACPLGLRISGPGTAACVCRESPRGTRGNRRRSSAAPG